MWQKLGTWARTIKRDIMVLWLAAHDIRTPWQAKLLAGAVAAYAFSPIDLIPDFIPILGYLDDVLLLPIGIWLAIRTIPVELVVELRARADTIVTRPVARGVAVAIVVIWVVAGVLASWIAWRCFVR